MSANPNSSDEELRLRELLNLDLLDTPREDEFDDIVEFASIITGCPISLISLVDRKRQWFKAKVGLSAEETSREISFCTHAIENAETFIVGDAANDPRFAGNPLVTGDPNIRFYAGQPLVTSNGFKIGTLCTIDRVPRTLSNVQIQQLELLAKQAVRMMELRLSNRQLLQTKGRLDSLLREVSVGREVAQLERLKFEEVLAQTAIPTALLEGPEHRFAFANRAYIETFELGRSPTGFTVGEVLPDAVEQGFVEMLDRVYATGEPFVGKGLLYRRKVHEGRKRDIYVDFTYAAKRNSANEIEGILATIVDVTTAVQLRQALENSDRSLTLERSKLASLFEAAPAAMVLFTGETLVLEMVNPRTNRSFPVDDS